MTPHILGLASIISRFFFWSFHLPISVYGASHLTPQVFSLVPFKPPSWVLPSWFLLPYKWHQGFRYTFYFYFFFHFLFVGHLRWGCLGCWGAPKVHGCLCCFYYPLYQCFTQRPFYCCAPSFLPFLGFWHQFVVFDSTFMGFLGGS